MLRSVFASPIAASAAGLACWLTFAAAAPAQFTPVPQRGRSQPSVQGPEWREGLRQQSGRSGAERDLPIPPPPSEADDPATRTLPPPPPDSPPRPQTQVPPRFPRSESGPEFGYPAPPYRVEAYRPSRRGFTLSIPGIIHLDINRGRDRYREPLPGYGGWPPVDHSRIHSLAEHLAKRLRDVHVYLHRQGVIAYYQPLMNTSRENLEAMKELSRKGHSFDSMRRQLFGFDRYYHPLERQLYAAAAGDPTLRQLVDVVARLEDDLHRALDLPVPR